MRVLWRLYVNKKTGCPKIGQPEINYEIDCGHHVAGDHDGPQGHKNHGVGGMNGA